MSAAILHVENTQCRSRKWLCLPEAHVQSLPGDRNASAFAHSEGQQFSDRLVGPRVESLEATMGWLCLPHHQPHPPTATHLRPSILLRFHSFIPPPSASSFPEHMAAQLYGKGSQKLLLDVFYPPCGIKKTERQPQMIAQPVTPACKESARSRGNIPGQLGHWGWEGGGEKRKKEEKKEGQEADSQRKPAWLNCCRSLYAWLQIINNLCSGITR